MIVRFLHWLTIICKKTKLWLKRFLNDYKWSKDESSDHQEEYMQYRKESPGPGPFIAHTPSDTSL